MEQASLHKQLSFIVESHWNLEQSEGNWHSSSLPLAFHLCSLVMRLYVNWQWKATVVLPRLNI